MSITKKSFRKAFYTALALSVLSIALICLIIVGPRYTVEFATSWFLQIAVGYAAMIIVVERFGTLFRTKLVHFWAGALFSFSIFIVGVLAGSATSMFLYLDIDIVSYIVKPLYWLSMYGFIPAVIIGIIGSGILRVIIKMENKSQHPTA